MPKRKSLEDEIFESNIQEDIKNKKCGIIKIEYTIKTDKYKITGNIKKNKQADLISEYLRSKIGAGKDNSPPNKKDKYHITLIWYPSADSFKISSDTGNKGLREGILMHILEYLKN